MVTGGGGGHAKAVVGEDGNVQNSYLPRNVPGSNGPTGTSTVLASHVGQPTRSGHPCLKRAVRRDDELFLPWPAGKEEQQGRTTGKQEQGGNVEDNGQIETEHYLHDGRWIDDPVGWVGTPERLKLIPTRLPVGPTTEGLAGSAGSDSCCCNWLLNSASG
jgi:hypothetical protein